MELLLSKHRESIFGSRETLNGHPKSYPRQRAISCSNITLRLQKLNLLNLDFWMTNHDCMGPLNCDHKVAHTMSVSEIESHPIHVVIEGRR
jgi:hypothetical protein